MQPHPTPHRFFRSRSFFLCGFWLMMAAVASGELKDPDGPIDDDWAAIKKATAKSRVNGCEGLALAGPRAAPAVPDLIALLTDHTPLNDRSETAIAGGVTVTPAAAACRVLEKIGTEASAATPGLIKLMHDHKYPFELEEAARAMAVVAPDKALPPIQLALGKYNKESRTRVVLVCLKVPLTEDKKPLVAALSQMLSSKDEQVSGAAAAGLSQLGSVADPVAPKLLERLKKLMQEADKTLPPATAGKKARRGELPLTQELARAVGTLGGEAGRKYLLELAKSEAPQKQAAALAGLGQVANEEARAAIINVLKTCDNTITEMIAWRTLQEMGTTAVPDLFALRQLRDQSRPLITPLADEALATILRAAEIAGNADNLTRHEYSQLLMGSEFRIVLYSWDEEFAKVAADAAFARIKRLDQMMTDYDPASELMQLCAKAESGRHEKVSGDLFNIIRTSEEWSTKSGGAFDITIGPFVQLWRQAKKTHARPSDDALRAAKAHVGWKKVRVNEKDKAIGLEPEMQLDLGGIAKGYAADAGLKVLKSVGLSRAMVDASGNVMAGNPPPGKPGWRIEVEPLRLEKAAEDSQPAKMSLYLKNASVSTSGDAYRFVEIEGTRYSHIVDPRTGLGLTLPSQVTVIAPTATTADALSTACCVLGPTKAAQFIDKTPNTAMLFQQRNREGKLETVQTSTWTKWLADD